MPLLSRPSLFDHPNNILVINTDDEARPVSCHLVPLMPKYPPQRPILKHPQLTFRRQNETLRTAVSLRHVGPLQHQHIRSYNKTDSPVVNILRCLPRTHM
jgi:hypothetical protein